ncbi:MAG: beta-lactamase family protein [Ectothiorhodospiraceae bacterium]|nr:beta-lactamase family protein [Ectothiorhodospiraceae bacterium]
MIPCTDPVALGLDPARLDRIDRWLDRLVEDRRVAGISLLINRHGENAHYHATGHADMERGTGITPDTIFRVYSMTKPVTSLAAMMLYEEGGFQLDEPIAAFLPEFRHMDVCIGGDADQPQLEPARSLITVRQLLTHTAGFSYGFMHQTPVDALYRRHGVDFGPGDVSLQEMVSRLAELPLEFQPGSRWRYGFSTDVLGRLVEVLSGESLDAFFRRRIFEPLGMGDTAFWVTEDKVDRMAAMYTASDMEPPPRIGPEPRDLPPPVIPGLKLADPAAGGRFARPTRLFSGGGGLTSTLNDYLRFTRMLRQGGELEGERLIGRKTLEYMRCNHLDGSMADMGEPRFNNAHMGAGLGFGLGFAVVLDPARAQTMGSPGEYFWTGMANTQFWIDPAEDLIVIQMAQLLPSTLAPVRRELRTLVHQALVG